MELIFYIAGAVAVLSTVLMVTRLNAVHALLYLIVSLLGVAIEFFVLGAPFAAALEAIVYAGAIMVLFLFVVMMLNLGRHTVETEKQWLTPGIWTGPAILAGILIVQIVYLVRGALATVADASVGPKEVGIALFGPYMIGVELASMLLLAGLVGAYHLGYRKVTPADVRAGQERVDAGRDLVLASSGKGARVP